MYANATTQKKYAAKIQQSVIDQRPRRAQNFSISSTMCKKKNAPAYIVYRNIAQNSLHVLTILPMYFNY